MNKHRSLTLLLPFRCVLFLLVFTTGRLITGKQLDQISNWWSVTASIVNIITILLLFLAAKRKGLSYRELIHYQRRKTTVKEIILVSLVILMIGMAGMYLAGFLCYGVIPYAAPMMIAPIPLWMAIINMVILPISTALAEEGLYLGCGVNQIENKYVAIVLPAMFFALQHSFIPTLFEWRYILYRFLSFLPLTLLLCWYYHKKRNPLPIMVGHAIIDMATVAQIFATSAIPGLYEKMCTM